MSESARRLRAAVLNNPGRTYTRQERYTEAEAVFKEAPAVSAEV